MHICLICDKLYSGGREMTCSDECHQELARLMVAYPGGKLDPIWNKPELSNIHPSKSLAIVDDYQVVYIQAEKIIGDTNQPYYEVALEDIK